MALGEATTPADESGLFVIGFARDAPARGTLQFELPDGERASLVLDVERRKWAISRVDGLPPSQVDHFTPQQLAGIEASTARKKAGDTSRARLTGFAEPFALPVEGRRTTAFGAQRILNGVEKRPHYGVDLAVPIGTPINAPADGVVALADDDLYFERAMIVLDHGQGFLLKYLHVSRVDVEPGEHVRRGQRIGAVGSRGRSTGPHLC